MIYMSINADIFCFHIIRGLSHSQDILSCTVYNRSKSLQGEKVENGGNNKLVEEYVHVRAVCNSTSDVVPYASHFVT